VRDIDMPPTAEGSVIRPKRASKTQMKVIQAHLGYDTTKWNALRYSIRAAFAAARLDWDADWPSQDPIRIARAWNTVTDEFPETLRFQGLWGLDRIGKQYWDNRNNYTRDLRNPNSYRSRHNAELRAAVQARRTTRHIVRSPVPSVQCSPAPSPPPSSSRRRPVRARIRSSSNLDEENPGDGNDEDPEDDEDDLGPPDGV